MSVPIPTRLLRAALRGLVDPLDAARARTAYYVLEHAENRTQLTIVPDQDHPQGYLAACITGFNPFQPVIAFDAPNEEMADTLLTTALTAGRSYLFVAGVPWSRFLETRVGATARFGRLYRLDAGALQPVVNVFVRSGTGANGAPRATIEARNRVVSAAGVNWIGSRFAEVYVTTDPAAQGRDWSRSVLAVVCANLLETGKIPLLYQPTDGQDNELAEAAARVGFTDTGSMGMEITGIYHGG